jgi:hypothetical protein
VAGRAIAHRFAGHTDVRQPAVDRRRALAMHGEPKGPHYDCRSADLQVRFRQTEC